MHRGAVFESGSYGLGGFFFGWAYIECSAEPRDDEMGGHYLCRIVIKGSMDEEAVLCTETQTFAMKSLEVSNSLLLIKPDAAPLVYQHDGSCDTQVHFGHQLGSLHVDDFRVISIC